MSAVSTEKKRYLLLRGRHNEGGRTYHKGEVIESSCDLMRLNGTAEMTRKFQLLGEGEVPTLAETGNSDHGDDTLQQMNVEQLRAHAAEFEIDVSGLRTKKEILAAIKEQGG